MNIKYRGKNIMSMKKIIKWKFNTKCVSSPQTISFISLFFHFLTHFIYISIKNPSEKKERNRKKWIQPSFDSPSSNKKKNFSFCRLFISSTRQEKNKKSVTEKILRQDT